LTVENGAPMSQGRHTPEKCSELEEALKKCHVSAAAGQFAATVRYEINNPLEAIANLTYLIKLDPGNAAKVHEHSDQIDHYLAIAVRIARSTLSFYRAQDTMEAIEVAALAEAALRVQKRKLTAKQAKLVKDIAADAVIMGHAGELLQVLSNLISNSIDALPPNGRLTIRVRKGPREVHLTVADEGHGIPETIRQKIFEPFFTTKKEHGTGFGPLHFQVDHRAPQRPNTGPQQRPPREKCNRVPRLFAAPHHFSPIITSVNLLSTTGSCENRLRTIDRSSNPDMLGMFRSKMIRSGNAFRTSARASNLWLAVRTS
jgi:anti-sigma regulatory factor (Ser/Thr protein kinase)